MNPGRIANIRYAENIISEILMLLITKLMSENTFGLGKGGELLKQTKNKTRATMDMANNET